MKDTFFKFPPQHNLWDSVMLMVMTQVVRIERLDKEGTGGLRGLHYQIGSALDPVGDGPKIICHVCNDMGGWGSGFVLALSERWSLPEQSYLHYSTDAEGLVLGDLHVCKVEDDISVINMIAQHETIRERTHPLDYEALRSCLCRVAACALSDGATVHMPRIGCGLAGGSWTLVRELVWEFLLRKGIEVYVYTLPGDTSWQP